MTNDQLPRALLDRIPELHRTLLDNPERQLSRADIELLVRSALPLCTATEVATVSDQLTQRLHGLGPLDALLGDGAITEIMVNGPGRVWIERSGQVESTDVELDESTINLAIDRVLGPLGLRVDRTAPFVDARLNDGSRVHVTVRPMAIDGPYLTIRRFSDTALPLTAFATPSVANVLERAVVTRKNILITGPTGSGKTSLVNTLASGFGPNDRVVTIEDLAELRLAHRHVVRLEGRPSNAEGVGAISMQTLVRNALRMRPDRLVVGEVRGAEAFDMIHALSTGHAGSLSTCHANSSADALERLTSMVLMGDGSLTPDLVRRLINGALDVVVHLERVGSGERRVTEIVTVGPDGMGEIVTDGKVLRGDVDL